MPLERRTIVDQVEVLRDGTVQVRMLKCIVDPADPDAIVASEYHRTVVPPGEDVEKQIAIVDVHLTQMGAGPCAAEEWGRVRRIVALEHTPEAAVAYREKMEARKRDVSDTGR